MSEIYMLFITLLEKFHTRQQFITLFLFWLCCCIALLQWFRHTKYYGVWHSKCNDTQKVRCSGLLISAHVNNWCHWFEL